jgi:hypothetical protein
MVIIIPTAKTQLHYDHTGPQHEIIHELMVVTVPSTNSAYH